MIGVSHGLHGLHGWATQNVRVIRVIRGQFSLSPSEGPETL